MRLLIGLLVCLPICAACTHYPKGPVTSQVPIPVNYRLSTQKQMQSVNHWMVLAHDIASQMKSEIEFDEFYGSRQSIYISPSGTTVFKRALHDLLITEFVNLGMPVSSNDKSSLILEYDCQIIEHTRHIMKNGDGMYRSLAPGFFVNRDAELRGRAARDVQDAELYTEAGIYTTQLPKNEIIFNVSLLNGDEFISRHSYSYYINDLEKWHYEIGAPYEPIGHSPQQPSRTFRLVSQ